MNARLDWLLECADRLRGSESGRIDIPDLFARLGINWRTTSSPVGTGALSRSADGRFLVTVKQYNPTLLWSARDRFTAAHELGHILLIKKWDFCPPINAHKDYYLCERLCNSFAGRLLVDPRLVASASMASAGEALQSLFALSKKCEVSLEAAARELVSHHAGVAFSRVTKNEVDPLCKLVWGVSSVEGFCETRRRHVHESAPMQAVLRWCDAITEGTLYSRHPSSAQHDLGWREHVVSIATASPDAVATLGPTRF